MTHTMMMYSLILNENKTLLESQEDVLNEVQSKIH